MDTNTAKYQAGKCQTVEYSKINEVMHIYNHASGLKAFVIPKKGYTKKHASFATNYGSANNKFIPPLEKEIVKAPDGVAHFLEHKLFEQEDGNVMDKFSELGSMPNAYTGFNQTAYLFSCTDLFFENFELLLDFVQNPYITDESVEKEKGIIGQEIRMYQDDPEWRVFFNLLGAFYKYHPVKIDIAGTLESIAQINRDILYKCYNTFYHPSNMIILVVGDVDPLKVFETVENKIKIREGKSEIKKIFPREEPAAANKSYIEQSLAVSLPLFQMGFKDKCITGGKESLAREVSIKILLDMLMGRSSALYNRLYGDGLINNTFDFDYTIGDGFAFSVFGGESANPEKIKDIISSEIEKTQKTGLDENRYEKIKKSLYGKYIRRLNSVESISHMFISVYFRKINIFDYLDIYDKISFKDVERAFNEHFKFENMALSVVKPL